jgi:hypothetical protein
LFHHSESWKIVKKMTVNVRPEVVAILFVTTLIPARANSTRVIRTNPSGISRPATVKLPGTFHSRAPGCL